MKRSFKNLTLLPRDCNDSNRHDYKFPVLECKEVNPSFFLASYAEVIKLGNFLFIKLEEYGRINLRAFLLKGSYLKEMNLSFDKDSSEDLISSLFFPKSC